MIPSWACSFPFNKPKLKLPPQKGTFTILIIWKWNILLKLLEFVTNILRTRHLQPWQILVLCAYPWNQSYFGWLPSRGHRNSEYASKLIYQQNLFYMLLPSRRRIRVYGCKYVSVSPLRSYWYFPFCPGNMKNLWEEIMMW